MSVNQASFCVVPQNYTSFLLLMEFTCDLIVSNCPFSKLVLGGEILPPTFGLTSQSLQTCQRLHKRCIDFGKVILRLLKKTKQNTHYWTSSAELVPVTYFSPHSTAFIPLSFDSMSGLNVTLHNSWMRLLNLFSCKPWQMLKRNPHYLLFQIHSQPYFILCMKVNVDHGIVFFFSCNVKCTP